MMFYAVCLKLCMTQLSSITPRTPSGWDENEIDILRQYLHILTLLLGILLGHFVPKDGPYVTSTKWLVLQNFEEKMRWRSSEACSSEQTTLVDGLQTLSRRIRIVLVIMFGSPAILPPEPNDGPRRKYLQTLSISRFELALTNRLYSSHSEQITKLLSL